MASKIATSMHHDAVHKKTDRVIQTVGHVMFYGNTRTHVLTFYLPGIQLKRRTKLVPWRQPNGPFDSILGKRKRSVEIGPLNVVIG